MTMRLELQPLAGPFVVEHPIMLSLQLSNDGDPVAFPQDYDAGRVVAVRLYDPEGHLLGVYDGDAQDRRLGLEPLPRPDAARPTEPMPTGASLRWAVDLGSYVALTVPGRYAVEVSVTFAPSGIDVRSERRALELVDNHVHALDSLLDVVATPVLLTAQVHEDEEGARLALHLRSVHVPHGPWGSGVLPVPRGVRPRVAEADFATRASFEHDFARWVAWREHDGLALRRFHVPAGPDDDGWGAPCSERSAPATRWLGRPIERRDGSVGVWLWVPAAGGGGTLTRTSWGADGVALGEDVRIAVAGQDPVPAVASSDGGGTTWIVLGEAEATPLTVISVGADGATRSRVVAPPVPPAPIVGLRLALKPHRDRAPGLLLAMQRMRDEGPVLWIGRAALEHIESPEAWSSWELAPRPGTLRRDETIVTADLVMLDDATVAVLAITSQGRVLRDHAHELRAMEWESSAAIGDARLVVLDGRAHAVLPTAARGLSVQE